MLCRNCGIEIADKALICYRCGVSTTEAKYQPAALPKRHSTLSTVISVLALVLLILVALYLGTAGTDALPRWVTWAVAAVAAVVLALRLLTRRR
jgi:hypothetical protein